MGVAEKFGVFCRAWVEIPPHGKGARDSKAFGGATGEAKRQHPAYGQKETVS
jgi:hypothetical protein